MEAILQWEVSKLWSCNLLEIYARSSADFDYKKNVMTKRGNALKKRDLVKHCVNPNGKPSEEFHTWEVVQLLKNQTLSPDNLSPGQLYNVFSQDDSRIWTNTYVENITSCYRHGNGPHYLVVMIF
eukprot:241463-Ditylum_brightwellii.AAC.1